jgi:ribosomal protein S18 acetylase RimI-like enzyme
MVDLPFPRTSAPSGPDAGVRGARPSDAADITAVQLAVWRRAYADVLPPSALDPDAAAAMAQHWAESIAAPPSPAHQVLVATAGRLVVGFATLGPLDDEPGTGEVADLAVHPDATRLGHGSRLLAAAVDHLRESACSSVVVWSAVDDAARLAFLRSAGLAEDGLRRRLDMGAGTEGIDELRLAARLD